MAIVVVNSVMLASITSLLACNPCKDKVISKVLSDDGRLVAAAYERDCGATTDFSTIVSVHSAFGKLSADDGTIFVAKGQHSLSIQWIGSKELLVKCLNCSRKDIYREVGFLGDIDINFN